jgi:hypothetical protein
MKKIIIGLAVASAVILVIVVDMMPSATVATPEVQRTDVYKRPVREGNCWRQFTADGSILVCG